MRYTHTAVAALIMMTGYTASAAAMTVFDLPLQQPFALSECPYTHITKKAGYYNPPASGVCYQSTNDAIAGTHAAITNDTVKIVWKTSPKLVSDPFFALGTIIDGNLEGVSFNTMGVQAQERDMDLLTAKFGTPSKVLKPTMQNGYGVQYVALNAEWRLEDIVVSYSSAMSSLTSGVVIVDTTKSAAARKATLERLTHGGPSL